jgi:hypothetical protein
MKFKVGDSVICIDCDNAEWISEVGLISGIDSVIDLWPIRVEFSSNRSNIFDEHELELVDLYNSPLYKALL